MNTFLRFVSCLSILLAGLLIAGTPPAAAETAIDDGFIKLGTDPLQLVPHQASGRVWVRGASRVEVADIARGTATGIDLADTRQLAVNTDGSKAYVSSGSTIVEIDATTLATRTFELGSGHCPVGLAAGLVKVYFGDPCSRGGILDPRTGETADGPVPSGSPTGVPGRDLVLYRSGTQLTVVNGADSTVLAQRDLPAFGAPQVSSDGTRVLSSNGTSGSVQVRDLDTLTPLGSVPYEWGGSSPMSLDLLGDLLLVAQDRAFVYDLDTGARVNRLQPDSPAFWWMRRVAVLGEAAVFGGWSWPDGGGLWVESEPRSAAPELSVDTVFTDDPFAPAPVEGILTDQGIPMAGQTITLTDYKGNPLTTAATNDEGRFAAEVRFPENTTLVARWSGGASRPSAVTYQEVWVSPTDTLLTLSAPRQVSPSDSVPVSVHLKSAAGSDADGMTVDLYRRCDGVGGWATVTSVVTGSDGTATYSDSAAPCLEVEYLARHESTQQTHTSAVVTSVMVSWQSSALELTTPDDVRVGDTSTVRARLLIDGQPAAERPVTLRAGDAAPQPLVTDSEGQVAVEIPFTESGNYRVRWDFDGDDVVLPTWADTDVWVGRRGTTLSAEPSATSMTVTETLTVSGKLSDERGDPVPNAEVRLRHAGPEVLTHTDADGSYTVQVQPGSWTPEYGIALEYDGDRAHEATSVLTIIDVQPLLSSLSVTADAPRAAAGDEVTLSGTLTTERHEDLSGEIVSVTRIDPDGTVTGLPVARLDSGGDFSFTDKPQDPGAVRYVVSHYGGNWYRTLDAETTVDVVARVPAQVTLETTVPNSWRRTGGLWLVSPKVQPRIVTAVGPRRAGVCLRYKVQRRVEGVWRTRETSGCRSTYERGKATYKMSSKPLGSRWRVRPIFAGDKLNAATSGAWVELQIRRPS